LAISSPEAARAMNNLAGSLVHYGELDRAYELWREALALAPKVGNMSMGRWSNTVLALISYFEGDWDAAVRSLDDYIADIERSGGHAQESMARSFRGRIQFSRGDLAGATLEAERALAAARRIAVPQSLIPALWFMTFLLVRTGRTDEAQATADELLATLAESPGDFYPEAALALLELGRSQDLRQITDRMSPTKWRDLGLALVEGDLLLAAQLADELRARPFAAEVRLRAAGQFADAGHLEEARRQLAKAVDFWRSVEATRHLTEAEELEASIGRQPAKKPAARASSS
jgi:tetratricopeptide (TPR) repeat protein